ncbi:hypothetical protein D8Y24_04405 [Agrococcus lahaulensis]|nr:hypothetical protein D8Y24_04405 [Agrococcus lahaulensis]
MPEEGVASTISRSLRVPTALWDDAKAKAEREGVVMNRLITELIEGWVHGVYRLPTAERVTVTKTYPAHPQPQPQPQP